MSQIKFVLPTHISGEKFHFLLRRTAGVRLHSGARFSSQTTYHHSKLKPNHKRIINSVETGFTLVELLVVIVLAVLLFIVFGTFFTNNLLLYSKYQTDASNFTELAGQSQRIADVLRGLTDIISESSNSLSVYAYFSPADTYVSIVNYYLNSSGTELLASVTPMTANPPTGTPITSSQKIYTIISNYYQAPGTNLFTYYDASGNVLTLPIADEHSIIEIGVNLAEPGSHTANGQQLGVTVSLRNRKTNL